MTIDRSRCLATIVVVAATGLVACGGGATGRVATTGAGSDDIASTSSTTTDGYPDGSSTSTSSPSSTTSMSSTTTTTTSAPAAAPLVLAGTHHGVEHFALGTGRCPQIDHHLDETFTLSDGTALAFASVYCGMLDASGGWSGTGTYTLMGTAGSLHGRSVSSVPSVPSSGAPYTLIVDGGAGVYAGTTGSCTVGEHLDVVQFGEQRHSGDFTCALDVATAPGG
jgi:hypothetical protein